MINSNRRYQRYFQGFAQLYQQKKVRFYTEIIATLGTIIFFLIFAIKPTLVTITGLIREIEDKKVVAAQADQKIQALMTAQANYATIESSLPLLDEALPRTPDLSLYLRQLESLARQSGLQMTSLQSGQLILKDTPQPVQEAFTLDFTLTGPFANHQDFLRRLYQFRRLTEVASFDFKTDRQTPDLLHLTLTAKVYIFDQNHVAQ